MASLTLVPLDEDTDLAVVSTPDHQNVLKNLELELRRAEEVLLSAYDKATSDRATPADRQQWVAVSGRWQQMMDLYSREFDKLQAQRRDAAMAEEWQRETRELERALLDQYGQRGEQYRMLCRVVAPMVVKLEKANEGGLRFKPAEHTDMVRTVSGVVAQLQKHTESTKTEADVRSQIGMMFVQVLDQFVGNQPILHQKMLRAIRHRIESDEPLVPVGNTLVVDTNAHAV